MVHQQQLRFSTKGRGTYDISHEIAQVINKSGIKTGICQIFIHHTSASLILSENADPTVRADLEAFMQRLVPDGDKLFRHIDEGSDDILVLRVVEAYLAEQSVAFRKTRQHDSVWLLSPVRWLRCT